MKKFNATKLIYYFLFIATIYFAFLPILSVILYGVFPLNSDININKIFLKSMHYLKNSLFIATLVTICSIILATAISFAIHRINFIGKKFLKYVVLLPLIHPPFVGSISFIMLFGKRGLITHQLLGFSNSPYGWVGIFIIQTLSLTCFAYLIISSSIVKIDSTIEDAARNLGDSEFSIFKKITLKSMYPEISTACVLTFLASMSDFGTPLIIGGAYQTLASNLYIQITGLYDMKSAAISGIVLLIPCIILFLVQKNIGNKKNYYSLNTSNPDTIYKFSNKPLRIFFITATYMYSIFVIMKYGFIVVGAFTKQWGYDYTFTLDNFRVVLSKDLSPFINSVQLAFFVAFFSAMLGVIISYLLNRKDFHFKKTFDFFATIPAAVPGILFGIGYLVTFKYPLFGIGIFYLKSVNPIILLGTGIIIYIICIFRYLNIGLRTGNAVITHINPNIEDAARNLGQNERKIFSQILLPLIMPAFNNAFFKNFSTTMTTLGAIIFLLLPSNKIAVQQIFQTISSSSTGIAASMALLLSLTTIVMLFIFRIINKKILRIK